MDGIDWGDAPTWFAFVAAAAAAVAAFLTLKSQREQIDEQRRFIGEQSATLSMEREELRALSVERRSKQAQTIAMYPLAVDARGPQSVGTPTTRDTWRVRVDNESDEPIHNVRVLFGDRLAESFREAAVFQGRFHVHGSSVESDAVELLGAGRTVAIYSAQGVALESSNRPVLHFSDNAAVRWRLDEHGDLREIESAQ